MSNAAHTQGPLRIKDDNCGGGLTIVDASGRTICHTAEFFNVAKEPIHAAEAKANAQRLVQCWNQMVQS